ncbi:hypothetical protein DFJ58DRAFT_762287 [Suillus subalutaceus]|uniref:uncharacterized protein n=1 Tax=Suillus subalutaceus TaxID=48586 RepID=UPI001B869991|nr:uncharacterized protein DFJ58DRAFT_762287 [Suillus subalutaceus]KAG1871764.1 hypothetical protein DFJ58DRAFT_762287 [Suillus subalutaceus]
MLLSSSTPKFRVAICGAGIGGLFAGRDIHIDLYEAHDAITTAGAGISVSRRTAEVMVELGLYEKFPHTSSSYDMRLRKSNAPNGGFDVFRTCLLSTVGQGSKMHRRDLLDILKQSIPSSCTDPLILYFADDSTSTADVLVGADGIRSSVRKTFFEALGPDTVDPSKIRHYSHPSWTGTACLSLASFQRRSSRNWIQSNVALNNFIIFCGKGKHIASYPVSQGTQINVAAYASDEQKAGTPFEGRWVSDVSLEEVEEAFQDFEPDAKRLLNCFEKPSRWALHVVNELPLVTCDRVALIGDAAHAMTPSCGAGAGQAIEDAFVLGKMFDFHAPGYYDGTDRGNEREEMEILKEKIVDQWNWESKGEGGAVAEWEKAERQLQEGSYNGGYENGTS